MISKETKIPVEHVKAIEALSETVNTHAAAMDHHALSHKNSLEVLWDTIKEILPDLQYDDFTYQYRQKEKIVACIGFKHD
jgi:hypothetical protein